MSFLDNPQHFLFFTGKGGVGKTALSCATALHLADSGKKVLLVSTDPASNLDQMLGTKLTNHPMPIDGAPGLFALNIDPEKAADEYRERVISPYRSIWNAAQITQLQEQLAGACTTEIAAFDEFAGLLAGDHDEGWDHVIFDTAPTGHTLRLLSLPRAWTGFLEDSPHSESCLGPHAGLKTQMDRFAASLAALTDPKRTSVVLVTRPEKAAMREAARTAGELKELGLDNQQLVINAIFEARDRNDAVAVALEQRGRAALDQMPDALRSLPTERVPLRPFNMVGLPALRALLGAPTGIETQVSAISMPELPPLASLFDELAAPGHGLIMVMGKGGVGKTTIAAAVAVELASRGFPVHLSTTDPAAHVANTLVGEVPGLKISRIDPAVETKAYVESVMANRGAKLDDAGRALLAEDLRSPCYEELAVFGAFSRLIREAQRGFVVLDTAPTGHTLLLLGPIFVAPGSSRTHGSSTAASRPPGLEIRCSINASWASCSRSRRSRRNMRSESRSCLGCSRNPSALHDFAGWPARRSFRSRLAQLQASAHHRRRRRTRRGELPPRRVAQVRVLHERGVKSVGLPRASSAISQQRSKPHSARCEESVEAAARSEIEHRLPRFERGDRVRVRQGRREQA